MRNYLQKLFQDISKDYIKDWIKANYMQYCSFASITIGGIMITQHIIGWFLVFLGFIVGIYQIQIKYKRLEEILLDIQYSLQNIRQFTSVDKKLLPFDTRFLVTDNKYLDMKFCVENLSNQVIYVICDTNKSYFTVDGIKQHDIISYKNNLYPYSTHSLQIHLMDLEKIPNDKEFTVKIYAFFKYGAFGCELNDIVSLQFEGTFLLSRDNSNNYELECIKITQPALPIN